LTTIHVLQVCVVPATPGPSYRAQSPKQRTVDDLFLDLNDLPEWNQFEQEQRVDWSDESSREDALRRFLTWKVRACNSGKANSLNSCCDGNAGRETGQERGENESRSTDQGEL
jgi:hypothetical protein